MEKKLILAHRGYRAKFPENTLLAFRKGFEAGADGLECDVQKTADGRYVIIHDGTIDRTAADGSRGTVGMMTLASLKTADLGKGERVPELSEFLKSLPEQKFINIELKDETLTPSDMPELCDMILADIENRELLISSFDHSLLPHFAKRNVRTGLLIGTETKRLGIFRLLPRIIRIRPYSMNLPIDMFPALGVRPSLILIRLFRLFGMKIFFWTVNTREQFDHAYRCGDGIITDRVEDILEMVREKEKSTTDEHG